MRAKSGHLRVVLLGAGWLLLVLSPAVGIVPGPGGLIVAAAGLVLLLRNSNWVKRRYVVVKRRWPRLGDAVDRAMRRPSALRRHARAAD